MFIDTHCHLNREYDDDVDALIKRANDVDVNALVCATSNIKDFLPAIKIAETHKNIFVTIGVHPDFVPTNPYEVLTEEILNNPLVVGIGEIGLDYHYNPQTRPQQIELFEQEIEIANKHKLPIAIHTRDAENDTIDVLKKYPGVYGVMHCFTSNWELAKYALDCGFYFSASGILTFKNSESIRETFSKIPNDRIVIETDSPFCAPVPYRGKQCEPYMVVETAKVLAQIKNLQLDDLENILFENTKQLYPKMNIIKD